MHLDNFFAASNGSIKTSDILYHTKFLTASLHKDKKCQSKLDSNGNISKKAFFKKWIYSQESFLKISNIRIIACWIYLLLTNESGW